MYTYMEYLQRCFNQATGWNEENIFSNITATSNGILNFSIPNNLRLDVSSQSSDFLASSFTLSNQHSVNGSVSYLYSSMALKNTVGTRDISLQEICKGGDTPNQTPKPGRDSLLYGRMYFPGSSLEAMIIKKLASNVQLLIKCISNPYLAQNGTMIMYLQKNTGKYSNELIYSTNESLIGLRCLYNFFDRSNSVVSMGTEIWYAARTMLPGLSTAFKYSLLAKDTPLTMTLAVNPILGHMSSTYTVKTSKSSKFCSRYDFNLYSYDSNLTLGFELFSESLGDVKKRFVLPSIQEKREAVEKTIVEDKKIETTKQDSKGIQGIDTKHGKETKLGTKHTLNKQGVNKKAKEDTIKVVDADKDTILSLNPTGATCLTETKETKEAKVIKAQEVPDFTSVFKLSTSLNDKSFKILWEGKLKDFLVSTGVKVDLNHETYAPDLTKFGITFSYAC